MAASIGVPLCALSLKSLLWSLEVHSRKSRNHSCGTYVCPHMVCVGAHHTFGLFKWMLVTAGDRVQVIAVWRLYPVTSSYPSCSRRTIYLNRSRTPCLACLPRCSVSPHKLLSTFNIGSEDTSAYPHEVTGEANLVCAPDPYSARK